MAENNPEIQGYVNGVFWERNSLSEQNATQSGSDATQKTLFDF